LDSEAEKAIISSAYLDFFIVQNLECLTEIIYVSQTAARVDGGEETFE
jgi:hypothetical protein